MKDMSSRYIEEIRYTLEIPAVAEAAPEQFFNTGNSWFFTTSGELTEFPCSIEKKEVKQLRREERESLPVLKTARRFYIKCSNAAYYDIYKNEDFIEALSADYFIPEVLSVKLRNFVKIRPLFNKPMHTGLGLVHTDTGEILIAARIIDGFGMVPNGFRYPLAMNLELTSQCPLRCPQCYCHLYEGRHMPFETAAKYLKQAGELGVVNVNLSGGETMCYPWLVELIKEANNNGIDTSLAMSGFGATKERIQQIIDAGATSLYVSLNGPTEEINRATRDGYDLAINLLEILRELKYESTHINWVVHKSNADTLPEMIALAEKYNVKCIMIMEFKPDSNYALPSLPSYEQMLNIAGIIKEYKGPVELVPEACYSSMKALTGKSFCGNTNTGPFIGCGAGRDSLSVSLEGKLSPCRHIEIYDDTEDMLDYWDNSSTLKLLRNVQNSTREPCSNCGYSANCRHCMAVNLKLNGEIYRGDATCPVNCNKGE